MIDSKYKSIFIHINKTGGTSIEHAFGFPGLGRKIGKSLRHSTASRIRANESRWDSFFKFSFVRNPWDKMVSFYHSSIKRMIKPISFTDWVFVNYKKRKNNIFFYNQYDWLCDEKDQLIVNFIGRFEFIKEDFDLVCSLIDAKNIILPYKNRSDRDKDYRIYYNRRVKNLVLDWYRKDIEFFGYEFDNPNSFDMSSIENYRTWE